MLNKNISNIINTLITIRARTQTVREFEKKMLRFQSCFLSPIVIDTLFSQISFWKPTNTVCTVRSIFRHLCDFWEQKTICN